MADPVDIFTEAGGWFVAVTIAALSFFTSRKKTTVDEITMVLDNWKGLVENHQEQLRMLTVEVIGLRQRVMQLEEELNERLKEIRSLKIELDIERDRLSTAVAKRAIVRNLGVSDGKPKKNE